MKEPRVCVICGKEFIPKSKSQQCCSTACALEKTREATRAKRKFYACQHCGKPFWKRDAFRIKYCSDECRRAAYSEQHPKMEKAPPKKINRTCAVCGQSFETSYPNQIYCGKDCRYNANLKQKRDQWAKAYQPKKCTCKECGTEFMTECGDLHSVFCCKSCAEKSERRKEHQTERHKAYMRTMKRVREKQIATAFVEEVTFDALFERDNGVCQICGLPVLFSSDATGRWSGTIDHIIPISLGGEHSMKNCQLAHRVCNSLKCQCDSNYSIDWKQKASENNYWRSAFDEYQQQAVTPMPL